MKREIKIISLVVICFLSKVTFGQINVTANNQNVNSYGGRYEVNKNSTVKISIAIAKEDIDSVKIKYYTDITVGGENQEQRNIAKIESIINKITTRPQRSKKITEKRRISLDDQAEKVDLVVPVDLPRDKSKFSIIIVFKKPTLVTVGKPSVKRVKLNFLLV